MPQKGGKDAIYEMIEIQLSHLINERAISTAIC
jgi:hypothetical protein